MDFYPDSADNYCISRLYDIYPNDKGYQVETSWFYKISSQKASSVSVQMKDLYKRNDKENNYVHRNTKMLLHFEWSSYNLFGIEMKVNYKNIQVAYMVQNDVAESKTL